MTKTKLTYVTDTYCIWCWGFGEALRGFAAQNADRIELEVLPGGLLVGDRVQPVGEKPRVLESAARVTEVTGVATGEGFRRSVEEGSAVLDSGVAARAYWALHGLAPGRGLEIAHALQHAWYWDGRDLRDPAVIQDVATELGLDAAAARRALADPATEMQALAGFERRKTLDVPGYPTLLVHGPHGSQRIGGARATPAKLTAAFERVLAGETVEQEDE
ncbi:DsbA family protein [Deinococcus piscis]|uniref:DsbA family protein n=1 Tax=Deinococcus piscis TaxID=394230 RepID=A0ABQ3KBL1_9DEIO|nr:DsbA family protein [Deinococcus piscis]GHG12713.1 DsbA family protein [Deinococcus piscis]